MSRTSPREAQEILLITKHLERLGWKVTFLERISPTQIRCLIAKASEVFATNGYTKLDALENVYELAGLGIWRLRASEAPIPPPNF